MIKEKTNKAITKETVMTINDSSTITSMTVDEFQNQCDRYGITNWEIDHMVYDLAKALKESKKNI
jgi:uncharacterized protein YeeX (DUF496 family)